MVHFLKQRTKHLTVQILGFLTIHIADVTEHLEMQRGEGGEERERDSAVQFLCLHLPEFQNVTNVLKVSEITLLCNSTNSPGNKLCNSTFWLVVAGVPQEHITVKNFLIIKSRALRGILFTKESF